jgi:hypothetical protein
LFFLPIFSPDGTYKAGKMAFRIAPEEQNIGRKLIVINLHAVGMQPIEAMLLMSNKSFST